ncbi:ribosome biogenesis GTPase RsgA [Artemisia annua]|uniref:Ribosome biogenesis GTPase RsgA n=1 Tax=Artemisia annua TaxID=35608 RepID=A0A2U1LKU5_ARTAN|nr:ribosome biogenesis GTPase RsgA [Artemisia annua]
MVFDPSQPPPHSHHRTPSFHHRHTVTHLHIPYILNHHTAAHLHQLTSDQAVGKVTAVSNNIKRVAVECANSGAWPLDGSHLELMWTVRSHLSDIYRKEVIVGDDVIVDAVDWNEGEGIIENVVERRSEIAQIANVEKVLILFSLDQPNLDEVLLTRYLIAAESSGIPVSLVVNKSELLDRKDKQSLGSLGVHRAGASDGPRHGRRDVMAIKNHKQARIQGHSEDDASAEEERVSRKRHGSGSAICPEQYKET